MSYGLLQTGRSTRQQAMQGLGASADLERNRNHANDQLDRQDSAAKSANAGMGAATGATIGANMATGVAGASVGLSALATGGVGLAAGLLLSELF